MGSKIKAHNDALTKVDEYFSEQIEKPKCSGKNTVSNLEKEHFSDQFSKKDKLPVKHTTLASINRINVKSAACQYETENKMFDDNAESVRSKIKAHNNALTKRDQYFSEENGEPKCSRKKSFDAVSDLEKEQFSDQFSKKDKLSFKHTSLASIITINVKSAACQYEAENKMLDDKVLETNVTASEESPDIKVKRKQCLDTD